MDQGIKKQSHTHTQKSDSAIKIKGIIAMCNNMDEPRGHYAMEISQTLKEKCCMISFRLVSSEKVTLNQYRVECRLPRTWVVALTEMLVKGYKRSVTKWLSFGELNIQQGDYS